MRNIKEVMSIGGESTERPRKYDDQENLEVIKEKFKNWCLGVGLSCLPLILFLVLEFLHDKSFCTTFYDLFCDIGIMFIGISFSVTAFNDFVGFTKSNNGNWAFGHILLIIIGAFLYTTLMVEKYENSDLNMDKVFGFNLGYFLVMLFVTASKYIRKIQEVR